MPEQQSIQSDTASTLPGALKDRYELVRDRIAGAAERSGRPASAVMLVAVTKSAETEDIRELIHLGHQDFGENRVQQLLQRSALAGEYLSRRKTVPAAARAHDALISGGEGVEAADLVRWHMIGPLQRNKVRKALEATRLVHSVDSLRIAEEIHAVGLKQERVYEALLQVNASGEATKGGVAIPAARPMAEQIDSMAFIRLRGLMTMAPHTEGGEDARFTFDRARDLFEEIRKVGVSEGQFNILSMGMTNDFEAAIECGSNMVRVGTAIFGPPREPDAH